MFLRSSATLSVDTTSETNIKAMIDYCNTSKVKKYLIFRRIDRFTCGGSYYYTHLKKGIAKRGVELLGVYGLIQPPTNTLARLGVSFKWSLVSPAENAELTGEPTKPNREYLLF